MKSWFSGKLNYMLVGFAASLNVMNTVIGLDYLWSVLFVFGTVAAVLGVSAWRSSYVGRNDLKLFFGFFVFSNISTLVLEVLMLRFDVWGFGNRVYSLTGITFIGAPIEEYIYWSLCPAVVALSYILMSRTFAASTSKAGTELELPKPHLLMRALTYMKYLQTFTENPGNAGVAYVDSGTATTYRRGRKFPTYLGVQLAIIAAIILMLEYYHGSKKALLWSTLVFFVTACPHEYYSLTHGFWVYNAQHMLGIYLAHIPLEGWLMYFLAPVCAGMMLDISSRKFFRKDI